MTIAIAHDYLTQRGGAERVVLSMLRAFPDATVHTSLYDARLSFSGYRTARIHTSRLNRSRLLRAHHRLAFPVLAQTFGAMHIDADVTIASSSGWAHGVHTSGRKIVYCHAPARWLYQRERYLAGRGPASRLALAACERPLRRWDRMAADTADLYLVNSTAIRDQVRHTYGIDADVLHPPVTIDVQGRRTPVSGLPQEFILCVARLQSYKNVDVIMAAMRRLPDAHLVVVGTGPLASALEGDAGPNVTFVGEVSDRQLRWLYDSASTLVGASYEDFGLTPIEAAAFGVPTVALRYGGYVDTVRHGETGIIFDELDEERIAIAMRRSLATRWNHGVIRSHARRFDEANFMERLRSIASDPTPAEDSPVVVQTCQRPLTAMQT